MLFGDPEEVVDDAAAGGADGAAGVVDDPAAEAEPEAKKVTIPREEYEALQRKARQAASAGAERATRETPTEPRAAEARTLQDRVAAREDRMARLRIAAKAGNEDAQVLVDTLEEVQASEQRQLYRLEMREVPESKREEVRTLMERQGFSSPYAAYKFLRSEDADTLEDENRKLKEQLAQRATPKPKVEGTKMPTQAARSSATNGAVKDIPYREWIDGQKDPVLRKELRARKAAGAKIVSS